MAHANITHTTHEYLASVHIQHILTTDFWRESGAIL